MTIDEPPVWPVDLESVRLWPMESPDGPLLQELFDDLADYPTAFGEPGAAAAVGTFLALPEGHDYDSKLLLGIWRNGGLAGALDCIMGYPTRTDWTIGMLLVADRHRRSGVASSVLDWLEQTAASRGAARMRAVVRQSNEDGLAFARAHGYSIESQPTSDPEVLVLAKSLA
jgi:ribosomal protein S18 acetylase RimI-like enzyme